MIQAEKCKTFIEGLKNILYIYKHMVQCIWFAKKIFSYVCRVIYKLLLINTVLMFLI